LKRISIVIAKDGNSTVETHGFSGSECQDASRFLETALGKATSEKLKPEFHQASVSNRQQASE
jgi:hypothetical protein